MVAERVNSSQKLLDLGEKGIFSSYIPHYTGWPAAVTGHKVLNEVWQGDT